MVSILTLHIEAHYSVLGDAARLARHYAVILARVLVGHAPEEEGRRFGQIRDRVLRVPHDDALLFGLGELLVLLEPLDAVHRGLVVAARHGQTRQGAVGALANVERLGLGYFAWLDMEF